MRQCVYDRPLTETTTSGAKRATRLRRLAVWQRALADVGERRDLGRGPVDERRYSSRYSNLGT